MNTSEIVSSLFYICFAVTLLMTMVILSLISFVLYLTVRPFNRKLYRKILWYLVSTVYAQVAFVADWWASMELKVYVNEDDFKKYFGNEHALLIVNHSYDIDWLPIVVLSGRLNMIGNIRYFVKRNIKYIPIFGWCFILSENIFLERSFAKDEKTIRDGIDDLYKYPHPLWLLLYPEGTWFTKDAHKKSQEYAEKKNLPQLNHHLQPRTKGFLAILSSMRRGKIPAIYDIEIAFKDGIHKPTLYNILAGKPITTYLYVQRIPVENIPEKSEDQELFLRQLFQRKDKLKENFMKSEDFFTSGIQREECLKVERPFYLVIIFIISTFTVMSPLCYYTLSLLLAGKIVYFCIILGLAVACSVMLHNAIKATEIEFNIR